MSTVLDDGNSGFVDPVLDTDYATFGELLRAAAETFPDKDAYAASGDRITYADWFDQSLRMAAALRARGIRPGDVVLVILESSIDFTVCFAAAQIAGAIASGVNTRLGRREIAGILDKTDPAIVILEDAAEVPAGARQAIRRSELAALRHFEARAALHPGKASDIAVIVWTSGTTGSPKGASFTHDNLRTAIFTAGSLAAPFARKLTGSPFAHAGYAAKCWEQIAYGISMIIAPTPWNAAAMLRVMIDERVTIAGCAPTQWAKLVELPELAAADLSHFKVGVAAMAPAQPELIEQVTKAMGAPIVVRYSMTECPSVTGTRIGDSPDVLYRTVGRPQPTVEVKMLDDDRNPVASGKVGRIAVRSPAVTAGYWKDPERTAEILIGDGWLLTGDYGRFDEDGNLVLAGRTNEMYIRGGYNIYPLEVERVLSEHPAVAAAAVVGTAAPTIGEIGIAFVVAEDAAAPPTLDELKQHVRRELADYKAPDALVILDAMPLTPLMKVDKQALKAQAAALKPLR